MKVLSIDQGTTSTRFMIFDHNGAVVGVDAVVRWPLPDGQAPSTAPLPAAAPLAQPLSHATLRVPA